MEQDFFRSLQENREKRNSSEGIPFFPKNFHWKSPFHLIIVNRGTGYETLEPSKARTMLLQSMLN